MILGLLDEAVKSGARLSAACDTLGLHPRTIQRWRRQSIGDDRRAGPQAKPSNALSKAEKEHILSLVNSPTYRDKSPKQIVPLLADQGEYYASESTIYRILREEDQVKHRSPSKKPCKRHRPKALYANGPNQVWSWDISYLKSPVRGTFYYLYMVLDIWSRKVVGFEVHDRECMDLASALIEATCKAEGVRRGDLSLHSDNGGPMKGATMLATLQELGVQASFSRPSVSNDNPYSESAFRTLKYRPAYPSKPFSSLAGARAWTAEFVHWYNHEHLHSSISFVSPSDRHEGKDERLLQDRAAVYELARSKHPER